MKTISKSEFKADALPAPLADVEWIFTSCPEDQLHWCDIYEYSRENQEVRQMVADYRDTGVWSDPGLFPDRCSNLLGKMFFEAFPKFPEEPFLSLPLQSRIVRCSALNKLRNELALRRHRPGAGYTNSQKTWSIEIHPSASRDSILQMLERWNIEHRGGQDPIDRLKFLAVLRLVKSLGKARRVLDHISSQRAPLAVKDESAISRDKGKAKKLIADVLNRIL